MRSQRRLVRPQPVITQTGHTFEIDSNASFLIKNETTAEQRLFSYAEVINGTYSTWLNGANGGVLEWRNNGSILSSGFTEYIRLISNNGNPYLNDWNQAASLGQNKIVNMAQDWVITVILDKDLNNNNQRFNLGIRGTGSKLFVMSIRLSGYGYITIDRLTDGVGYPDYDFRYPWTDAFKLFTFSKIGGVFNLKINNANVALAAGSNYFLGTETLEENQIILGANKMDGRTTQGKITNYKHLKVLTGDLSSFDISGHNQDIMTKYGI